MDVYFTHDMDAQGGFYDIFLTPPMLKITTLEIRQGVIDDTVFGQMMDGTIPVNPETFFDTTLEPLFNAATTVYWTREGGYVNGGE